MSRTRPSARTQNPVERLFFFNGKTGQFGELTEKDEVSKIENVDMPKFIHLDSSGFRIGGENRAIERRIKSTEGHYDRSSAVRVYYSDTKEEIASGDWSSIKTQVKSIGGKYINLIRVMIYNQLEKQYQIATLHLSGRAGAEWLKFKNKQDVNNVVISITGIKEAGGDKGVSSFVPEFSGTPIESEDVINIADQLDIKLQDYLDALFMNRGQVNDGEFPNEPPPEPMEPINGPNAEQQNTSPAEEPESTHPPSAPF